MWLYFPYFNMEICQRDKLWVSHGVCKMCVEQTVGERFHEISDLSGVPMIWTNIVDIYENNRHK